MFEGFKPTKAERAAILRAAELIRSTYCRSEWEFDKLVKEESRGYGIANDRIPKIAATGLCVSFFRRGTLAPNEMLRDCYWMRPAAIWLQGLGAAKWNVPKCDPEHAAILEASQKAYDAAFDRMQAVDRATMVGHLQGAGPLSC